MPEAPRAFWGRTTIALLAADGAAKGADAYFTHRILAPHRVAARCVVDHGYQSCFPAFVAYGREADPIAQPFVGTTAGQVGYFAASWAGDTVVAYLFHRTGHHKLERAALLIGISQSASAATFTSRGYRQ